MSRSKIFPFQPKLDANECHFCLPQLQAVIHLTLSMRIVHEWVSSVRNAIDQVNWITAHNYGELKLHLFSPSLSWKGKIWGPRHCLTKCALANQLLNQNCWSWHHFSRSYLIQWYKLLHPYIVGSILFRSFWATLYNEILCTRWMDSCPQLFHKIIKSHSGVCWTL